MGERAARGPVLILCALFVLFLSGGFFFVDSTLGPSEAQQEGSEAQVTYLNHDITSSLVHRSDFVGDQGNTFALLGTLPLSEHTALMSVIDNGVRIQLEETDATNRDVQRDMAYTASVLMMTISNVDVVVYEIGQSRVEITRGEVIESLGVTDLGAVDVREWETVRERIPLLAEDYVRVVTD